MTEKYLKPAEGRTVIVAGRRVPAEGRLLVVDSFVARRLRDGDLVEAEAPKEPRKPARQED